MIKHSRFLRRARCSLLVFTLVLVVSPVFSRPSSSSRDVFSKDEIGELLMVGVSGTQLDETTRQDLLRECPGSIILFRRNFQSEAQAKVLVSDLRTLHQQCSRHPLFVGVDQEGGPVTRIPLDPPLPSAWSMGQTQNPQLIEALGYEVGLALQRIGINLNFAPVLDLGASDKKSFIGARSFGDTPETVSAMGTAYAWGLVRAQVLPVAKHFPGMGSETNDPHVVAIRRNKSPSEMEKRDLVPFRSFADLYPTAIMPSHFSYPGLTGENAPGTFSKNLLSRWLRDQMNYRGVIISDDLLMKGAASRGTAGREVIRALQSGVDVTMLTSSASGLSVNKAIHTALASSELKAQDLSSKIARIRNLKRVLGLPNFHPQPRNLASIGTTNDFKISGSHSYSGLVMKVLEQNLLTAEARGLFNQGLPRGAVYLWPQDLRLKWQIERALHQQVFFLDRHHLKNSESKEGLVLSFVQTRHAAKVISAWPASLKARTFVINQLEPGTFKRKDFLQELPLYLDHPMIGAAFAKMLKGTKAPSLVRSDF